MRWRSRRELPWKNDLRSTAGFTWSLFKYSLCKDFLWSDGLHISCYFIAEAAQRQPPPEEQAYKIDEVTQYVASLRACAKRKDLHRGSQLHDDIMRKGLLSRCSDALVTMYAKCGALAKAKHLLDMYKSRNVFTWTAVIEGYAQIGRGQDALKYYESMQQQGLLPIAVTYNCLLTACGNIGAADTGERIHDEIAKQGLLRNNVILGNALVSMYAKCGVLAKAQQVLEELPIRNAISWNGLITGYAERGEGEKALACYEDMQREGISPSVVTFICILKACSIVKAADKGEKVHNEIAKQGLLKKDYVLGTALVDMYAKCGALAKARRVLEELPSRDIVSWNALITGHVQQGEGVEALNSFQQMQRDGFSPDAVTYICVIKACGSIGAADKGEMFHDEIARQGLLANDIVLGTALVDMYAKCGALAKARQVLEELPVRNAISWNALISGAVQQGEIRQALLSFEQMQNEGLLPDAATFSSVLSACSRVGLVQDAQIHLVNMSTKYGMKPDLEQYTCLIDLFGRMGHLDKSLGVLDKLPSSDSGVWSALLGACWKWGDVNLGRWAFESAMRVDRRDAATYVHMANISAAAGMQEEAENGKKVRTEIP